MGFCQKPNQVIKIYLQNFDCTSCISFTSFALTVASFRYVKLPRPTITFPCVLPSNKSFQALSNHLRRNVFYWSFTLVALTPPSAASLHKLFLFIFSKAFWLEYFFFHENVKTMLSTCARTSWGSDRDWVIQLIFNKTKVFVVITFPYNEGFRLYHLWTLSLTSSTFPVQLRGIFEASE